MQDNTDLQEIKDRLNIADVIGGYISLKKAGVNFKAPCPFHNEKSPSLVVSPQKQIWHCFGCGEGGDVFSFVKRIENLEFKDVLKILAEKAGVKLKQYVQENPDTKNEKELFLKINDFAARYYNKVLFSKVGQDALEYLKKRGLNEITINKWQIGFAPEEFHFLEKALLQKKVYAADLIKAGVSAKNERGQVYDRFRGRITFPIYNYFGEIIGFSARILKEGLQIGTRQVSPPAKYVNSPETIIYNKGQTLFGLNFAKEAIRKKDEVVLVEGQMDCVSAHQSGFLNTVATSGTALTERQLQVLSRLTKNLKFCFDSDAAGKAAAKKAGQLALPMGFKVKMVLVKDAKDPDELIKKSSGLWEKALVEAIWFLDYFIKIAETDFSKDIVEQKHYLNQEVIPLLGFIQNPLEQDHYVKQLVNKFGISEKVILQQIKNKNAPIISAQVSEKASPNLLLEKNILGGILFSPKFLEKVLQSSSLEDFQEPEIIQLVEPYFSGQPEALDKNSVLAKEALFMVESELEERNGDKEKLLASLEKNFVLFKINSLKKRQQAVAGQIRLAEQSGEKQLAADLQKKFSELSKQRLEAEKELSANKI